MIFLWIISFLSIPVSVLAQQDCSDPFKSSDNVLISKNYPASQTAAQVQLLYTTLLENQERLEYRVMRSETGDYKIPLVPINSHGIQNPTNWVPFPEHIAATIIRHTHQALEKNYAQHVFFPDMGHGHFYLPQNKAVLLNSTTHNDVSRWTSLMNDPELVILYHTRENYDLSESLTHPDISFYNEHRNLLGSWSNPDILQVLAGPGGTPNTVRVIPNMASVGTIYFSATAKGCFPFTTNNSPLFLDFSFHGHSVEKAPATDTPLGGK